MKWLAVILLASLVPSAEAATYWVAPDSASGIGIGSPYRSGNDTSSVFPGGPKTLAWFNANAQPGDVCRFKSGDYGLVDIDPRTSGTTSNRIRYYGFPNDPGAVRVGGVQIGETAGRWGSHVTVRWVTTTSSFAGIVGFVAGGQSPMFDSLVACRSKVANSITVHGRYHVLDSLDLRGTNTTSGNWFAMGGDYNCDDPSTPWPVRESCSESNQIRYLDEPVGGNVIKNSTFRMHRSAGTNDFKLFRWTAVDSSVFFNNAVVCTVSTTANGFMGLEFYNCDDNNLQANSWTFVMSATPNGTRAAWSLRDWSDRNRFVNNTVTITGAGTLSLMPTNSGSVSASCDSNYFGGNTIKVDNPQISAGVLWFQNGMRGDTLELNTVATSSTEPCITIDGAELQAAVIRHNVFFTNGATAVNLTGHDGTETVGARLVSNVFYAQTANNSTTPTLKVRAPARLDSAGVFFALGASTAANAIMYGARMGAPGSGTDYGGTQSQWCSPMFEDSVYATLDARVTAAGCAVGDAWSDGFAGVAVSDADVTAPVVTLTFPADTSRTWTASETMPLTWTASDAVGVSSIVVQYGAAADPGVEPATWSTITTLSGATTSYNWIMAGVSEPYGFVRVRALDAAGNVGADSQVYKFNNPPDTGDIDTQRDTP